MIWRFAPISLFSSWGSPLATSCDVVTPVDLAVNRCYPFCFGQLIRISPSVPGSCLGLQCSRGSRLAFGSGTVGSQARAWEQDAQSSACICVHPRPMINSAPTAPRKYHICFHRRVPVSTAPTHSNTIADGSGTVAAWMKPSIAGSDTRAST